MPVSPFQESCYLQQIPLMTFLCPGGCLTGPFYLFFTKTIICLILYFLNIFEKRNLTISLYNNDLYIFLGAYLKRKKQSDRSRVAFLRNLHHTVQARWQRLQVFLPLRLLLPNFDHPFNGNARIRPVLSAPTI